MKKAGLFFFFFLTIVSFKTDQPMRQAERYIEHINQGQFNEAYNLTTDDFEVIYAYQSLKKNKKEYFKAMKNKVLLHPVIRVDSISMQDDRVICRVENSTDFNTYLNLPKSVFLYNFWFRGEKISRLTIDSLNGYSQAIRENDTIWFRFHNWIRENHPELADTFKRNPYSSFSTDLLKAYSEKK